MGATIDIPDHVQETVRRAIAESLAVEPDTITLEQRLIDDLGADSLDFVDIVFMLEQELGIQVRDTELSFLTRLDFSSPEVMKEGHLTEEVVGRLSSWLPGLAELPDRDRITPAMLFSQITVRAMCVVASTQLANGRD